MVEEYYNNEEEIEQLNSGVVDKHKYHYESTAYQQFRVLARRMLLQTVRNRVREIFVIYIFSSLYIVNSDTYNVHFLSHLHGVCTAVFVVAVPFQQKVYSAECVMNLTKQIMVI